MDATNPAYNYQFSFGQSTSNFGFLAARDLDWSLKDDKVAVNIANHNINAIIKCRFFNTQWASPGGGSVDAWYNNNTGAVVAIEGESRIGYFEQHALKIVSDTKDVKELKEMIRSSGLKKFNFSYRNNSGGSFSYSFPTEPANLPVGEKALRMTAINLKYRINQCAEEVAQSLKNNNQLTKEGDLNSTPSLIDKFFEIK